VQTNAHNSEFGRWQTAQRDAHPALRAFVHGFFASSSELPNPVSERHLPSLEVALLLNFGAPHRRLDQESGGKVEQDGAWVIGLHDRPQRTEAFGERHFMAVRFTPVGAYLLLGLPMQDIASRAVALDDIDPTFAGRVVGKVGAAKGWSQRFDAMEALIADRLEKKAVPAAIAHAWERIATTEGGIAIAALASELECSQQHLAREFQTRVGFAPKTVAQLFRFNRAVRLLNRRAHNTPDKVAGKPYIEMPAATGGPESGIPWADLAARCGYFDQPHFIREFQRFAGLTPTAFLRTVSDVD
jgi:AraC-like DNA-binding protein